MVLGLGDGAGGGEGGGVGGGGGGMNVYNTSTSAEINVDTAVAVLQTSTRKRALRHKQRIEASEAVASQTSQPFSSLGRARYSKYQHNKLALQASRRHSAPPPPPPPRDSRYWFMSFNAHTVMICKRPSALLGDRPSNCPLTYEL